MVEEYVRLQRAWLGKLYPKHGSGSDIPSLEPVLDPQSPQWNIVQVLRDVVESKIGPPEAAQCLADITLRSEDTETLYNNLLGCFFNATESFSDVQTLTMLSNLLASLASLEHAVIDGPDPIIAGTIEDTAIEPNHSIQVHVAGSKKHPRHNLLLLPMNITERMQGPEAYLCHNESISSATRKWKNINSFLAILVHDHGTMYPTLFGNRVWYAFGTLAMALEHPPGSRLGRNMALHLPAACAWLLLARDTVWKALEDGNEGEPWKASAGQLWRDQVGTNVVDKSRWAFWKARLEAVKEDPRVDAETADMLLQASRLI